MDWFLKNKLVSASCSQAIITQTSLSNKNRWKNDQSKENCTWYKDMEICAAKTAVRL